MAKTHIESSGGKISFAGKFSITDEAKTGLLKERPIVLALVFCIIVLGLQTGLILLSQSKFPPQIPLFYSKPWGEAMLTSPIFLWALPIAGFIFVTVNFIFAVLAYQAEKFIARVLVFSSALVAFISFFAVLKIITLLI